MDRLAPALRTDPDVRARVAAIGSSVLRRHGEDVDDVIPTGGWVNAGWMSNRFVVKVGLMRDQTALRREAQLAVALPAGVSYPEVVEVGVMDGHEYMLARRMAGTSVRQAWPVLAGDERADALAQMWQLAEQVHQLELRDVEHIDLQSSPFYAESLRDAVAAVREVHDAGLLTDEQETRLVGQLNEFFDELPTVSSVLNHGDLTIGNAMWDGERVAGLLDFEFAVVAPAELDLNELAKHAFGPGSGSGAAQGRDPVQLAILDIVAMRPIQPVLFTGYSILLESWLVRRALDQPPDDVKKQESWKRLVALADGSGGFLAPLLES